MDTTPRAPTTITTCQPRSHQAPFTTAPATPTAVIGSNHHQAGHRTDDRGESTRSVAA
jgi:hypothetical protein